MPRLGPIKRSDLIRYLKQLGFEGPYSGGKPVRQVLDELSRENALLDRNFGRIDAQAGNM